MFRTCFPPYWKVKLKTAVYSHRVFDDLTTEVFDEPGTIKLKRSQDWGAMKLCFLAVEAWIIAACIIIIMTS